MRRERLIYLALLLGVVGAYFPVAYCKFSNLDDWAYAADNPVIHQGLTWSSIRWAFTSMLLGNWHPVTWLSHLLDYQLFGLNPGPQHLVNVGFHAANTLLVFHLLKRLTREVWPSALVAALFAWHPLHVESVAWISERKDVLSTFFGLLTIEAYVSYVMGENRKARGERREAEDPSPGLPPSHFELRRTNPPPSPVRPVLRSLVAKDGREREGVSAPSTFSLQPGAAQHSKLYYALALVCFTLGLMSKPMLVTWPFVLLLMDFWPLRRVLQLQPGGAGIPEPAQAVPLRRLILEKIPFFLLTVASTVVAFVAQHLAGAIPKSTTVSLSMSIDNALVSYLRYLGKTFWPHPLAVYYPYLVQWPEWAVIGSVLVLAFLTAVTISQWSRRPYLVFGWLWFLGTLVPVIGLVQVGAQSIAERYMYIPSIGLFLMIVWWLKDVLGPWQGVRTAIAGAVAGAVLACCIALTVNQLRYWRDGESLFRHTLDVTKDNMVAEYGLGEVLVKSGRVDEGLEHLQRAVKINPRCFSALARIADLLSRQGKIHESIAEYRLALSFEPDLAVAQNNLAWILATYEDPEIRDGPEAVRLAEKACATIQFQTPIQAPSDLDTLAAAYAEVGRYADAIKTAEKACAAARAIGRPGVAEEIRRRIELYRDGKPVRQKIPLLKNKAAGPVSPSVS